MSPDVELIVPVVLETSSPRRFASGVRSRSANVTFAVWPEISIASPAELLTVVLPKLAATPELDIEMPDGRVVLKVRGAGCERAGAGAEKQAVDAAVR